MFRRCVAAGAALIMSVGTFVALPTLAHAASDAAGGSTASAASATDAGSIIYVSQGICTNYPASYQGLRRPYCTIQDAANVVKAGQTVDVMTDTPDKHVKITHSGTASAPIRFVGVDLLPDGTPYTEPNYGPPYPTFEALRKFGAVTPTMDAGGTALNISGANYVEISHFAIYGQAAGTVVITNSSHIELTDDVIQASTTNAVILQGTGDSHTSAVTLAHDYFPREPGVALEIDPRTTGTKLVGSIVDTAAGAIALDDASDTTVISNSFLDLEDYVIQAGDGETNMTIENNVGFSGAAEAAVQVDQATIDYNVFVATDPRASAYEYGSQTFKTASDLYAATGQGEHDVNTGFDYFSYDPTNYTLKEGSSAINSGDASVPGEPATDFYGNPRVVDPNDPVTGTGGGGFDRGAVEIIDPLKVDSLVAAVPWEAGTMRQTLTAKVSAPWTPALNYHYVFGDGKTQDSNSPTIQHTYTSPATYTPTVTVTDTAHGSSSASALPFTLAGGNAYYPLAPTRVLDTRHAIGVPTARIPANGTVTVKLAGTHGIPSTGAVAVVLNVTVAGPAANGLIMVYPAGTPTPNASNLNYLRNENRSNLATVKLGTNGSVTFRNTSTGSADLVADLQGYYAPGLGSGLYGFQPTRTDTTTLTAGQVTPAVISVQSANFLHVGGTAVVVNVTASAGTAPGYLTLYPHGSTRPTASNLNYSPGESISNLVIVQLGKGGGVDIVAGGRSGAQVKVTIDLLGVFTNGTKDPALGFVPTEPTRILDTRTGLGVGTVGPQRTVVVNPLKLPGVPAKALGLATNLTVVDPAATGYLSAFAYNRITVTSSVSFPQGHNVANMDLFSWSYPGDGANLYLKATTTTGMVLDMFGYYDL